MATDAVSLQQASTQLNSGLAMMKKSAQAERSLVNMIEEVAKNTPAGPRGRNLDITI